VVLERPSLFPLEAVLAAWPNFSAKPEMLHPGAATLSKTQQDTPSPVLF
jgi:hypothetical protein